MGPDQARAKSLPPLPADPPGLPLEWPRSLSLCPSPATLQHTGLCEPTGVGAGSPRRPPCPWPPPGPLASLSSASCAPEARAVLALSHFLTSSPLSVSGSLNTLHPKPRSPSSHSLLSFWSLLCLCLCLLSVCLCLRVVSLPCQLSVSALSVCLFVILGAEAAAFALNYSAGLFFVLRVSLG